jgi:chromosome partitioning protein
VAAGLALNGKTTLVVDCDPQGQAATFLGLPHESAFFDLLISRRPLADVIRPGSTSDASRPNLYLIPGDKRTATAQIVLTAEGFKLSALADTLADVTADFILFDTSPSVGLFQEAALYASDWLIVPTAVDFAAAEGLVAILSTLDAVKRKGGQCTLMGVLPTFYDEQTRESKAILEDIKGQFADLVWAPIHRATVLRECVAEGLTIWEKAPNSRAAREYAATVQEVLANDQ